MSFTTANGVRLHTTALGAGPPVVMLHGLLIGSLASWYFTAAPALARTHAVQLYDLRGHGLSDRPVDGYDTATMAADLAALIGDRPERAGSRVVVARDALAEVGVGVGHGGSSGRGRRVCGQRVGVQRAVSRSAVSGR